MIAMRAEPTTCKACGKPITQSAKPTPYAKEFCNGTCRQRANRKKKKTEQPVSDNVTMDVTMDAQNIKRIEQYAMDCSLDALRSKARITELEAALRTSNEQTSKLTGKAAALEREVQHLERILARRENVDRLAQLEQELARYKQVLDLSSRSHIEQAFLAFGAQINWRQFLPSDTMLSIVGEEAYRNFAKTADEELLLRAAVRLKDYAENLIAVDSQVDLKFARRRIADLERQVKDLHERLDVEERFRLDVEVRTFKSWLRTHPQPRDTDFAKRFLDDRDMPLKTSRAKYEAIIRTSGNYSQVDIELFKDAWKVMILEQS